MENKKGISEFSIALWFLLGVIIIGALAAFLVDEYVHTEEAHRCLRINSEVAVLEEKIHNMKFKAPGTSEFLEIEFIPQVCFYNRTALLITSCKGHHLWINSSMINLRGNCCTDEDSNILVFEKHPTGIISIIVEGCIFNRRR